MINRLDTNASDMGWPNGANCSNYFVYVDEDDNCDI